MVFLYSRVPCGTLVELLSSCTKISEVNVRVYNHSIMFIPLLGHMGEEGRKNLEE